MIFPRPLVALHPGPALSAIIVATVITSGLALAAFDAAAGEVLAGPIPAEVVNVVDGDTIVVRARIWLGQNLETRVRLAGVDAPEIKGKCERERALAIVSRDFVVARMEAARTSGAAVTLHDIQYGKFAGRVVARMEIAGTGDLGAALITAGLARPYSGGRRQTWCG